MSVAPQYAANLRQSQYESVIVDFIKQNGRFIVTTDDQSFTALLRSVLLKRLALADYELMTAVPELSQTLRVLRETDAAGYRPFLLLERRMSGQDSSFLVKQFKEAFPSLLLLILTVDVERHRIMYLHELGADNFIAKPVSANTLVEKLAFTIQPQNKLGKVIDLAKQLLQRGLPEKAKLAAAKILEMKPDSPAGLLVLGDAEMAMGNMEAAKKAYLLASENADLYLEPLRKLAALAEHTGNTEEQLAYLEQLDRLSPLNADRKVDMGSINLNLGREEKAHDLFDAAVKQVSRDARGQISDMAERIATAYGEKDPARSESYLRKALDIKKDDLSREDVRVFNKLGISLRQQGKWQEAVDVYKRALKIAPEDENLLYNIAMAYWQGEQFREARLNMEAAYAINSKLPYAAATVAFNMGLVFKQGEVRDKARVCFEAALELDPDMVKAREALSAL